jgi:hypothetical protein
MYDAIQERISAYEKQPLRLCAKQARRFHRSVAVMSR